MGHDPVSAGGDGPGSDADLARTSRALREALSRYFRRKVSDQAEIDDLVQDVFLRIVKRGGTEGLENLDGYIFETAASVLNDRFRRRKVRHADHHLPFDQDQHASSDFSPERVLVGRQAVRATTVALMELPARTRDVFVLRRLEGLPYNEIAKRLGLSVSAVEKHMLRATRHLVARVGDDR
jgi:RNA polymerase sigma-70 factor (ECF subfamily)